MPAVISPRVKYAVVAAAILASCGGRSNNRGFPFCTQDSDCGSSQVCFVDGCGDPERAIRVEVTPNAQQGFYAQDFALDSLSGKVNLDVTGPTLIQGQMRQGSLTGAGPYTGLVSIRASGESVIIPGLFRVFQSAVRPPDGTYSIPVGAGSYSVLAEPLNDNLPPSGAPGRAIVPTGGAVNLDFLFPPAESLQSFRGQLLKSTSTSGAVPVVEPMEVQAWEFPGGTRPISQRVQVTAGTGDFTLALSNSVTRFVLQASPVNADALVPSKSFVVAAITPDPVIFELGDYGDPVRVSGTVYSSSGNPVAGARVHVAGRTKGDGSFTSATAATGANGRFSFSTLTSPGDSPFTLWISPPASSDAGLLTAPVAISSAGELGEFWCPSRVSVQGSVLRPDGTAIGGVVIMAEAVAAFGLFPMPGTGDRALSDRSGNFSLKLDPAIYRLDFVPGEQLPRASRYIVVQPPTTEVPPVSLSRGRRLLGSISSYANVSGSQPPPVDHVLVRFFRLVSHTQLPNQTSVLLGQTTSDSRGNYSLILPVR